jgi:hypothetical protein
VNNVHKFILISIIISLVGGLYSGYLIALSNAPIEKNIEIPESTTTKLVRQATYEHHRAGEISYLTTGPTFSQFVYSCEPGPASYAPGGPDCLVFAYDGIPGLVELKIPKHLITEFPVLNEVRSGDPPFNTKEIPFQIISKDNSFVTIRIELPSNYDVIEISGTGEGLISSVSPFLVKLFGLGFGLSWFIFLVFVLAAFPSKKLIDYLKLKFSSETKGDVPTE